MQQEILKSLSLVDPDVKFREFRGLIEAMNLYKLDEGLILTLDEEDMTEIHEDLRRIQIKVMPIWKWLMDSERSIGI